MVHYWLTPNDVVYGRAWQHPKNFAHIDHFGENAEIAVLQGLLVERRDDEFDHPMAEIQTITNTHNGQLYGSLHHPSDEDDFRILLGGGLWLERHARALMVIQLRIYRFLRGVVAEIMSEENNGRFISVANETNPIVWRAVPPAYPGHMLLAVGPGDNAMQDDEYQRRMQLFRGNRHDYIESLYKISPYTSSLEDVGTISSMICFKHSDEYESRLQGIKARPDQFFGLLFDLHEHSHYVLKGQNGETHPWVSHFMRFRGLDAPRNKPHDQKSTAC